MARTYSRDGRSPVPKNERVSELMSRIRGRDTGPEKVLRSALRAAGVIGYRLHYAKAPGRPDIAFVGRKIAIFVHGCFWHGCPHCQRRRPRNNSGFWNDKLDRNIARDKRKRSELVKGGWRVIIIRECRLKKAPAIQLKRVMSALEQ